MVEDVEIKRIFAKNVKLYRTRLGLTQEDLGGICAQDDEDALANRSYISDIETCRRNITLEKIGKLARALKVEPYKLFLTREIEERL